ncbi:hypothetical protein BASA81_001173 [Batrachochytrium salamandrivorans]|nr:hypothetical protein BASA81_001173 [Batrachochytrium salamandrivorans]
MRLRAPVVNGWCFKYISFLFPSSTTSSSLCLITKAAQVRNLQAVLEQRPQRAAQHHAMCRRGETNQDQPTWPEISVRHRPTQP